MPYDALSTTERSVLGDEGAIEQGGSDDRVQRFTTDRRER